MSVRLDPDPPSRARRLRRRLAVALAAILAGVGTAIVQFVVNEGGSAIKKHAPDLLARNTPPIQITVAPEFSGKWVLPSNPDTLGKPPRTACYKNEYRRWLQESKAIPTFNAFAVSLKANTDATVIVEGMAIDVLKRRRPITGMLLDCAIGGPGDAGPIGTATINLDRAKPSITYADQYDEQIKRLSFKLERDVDEFVIINAESTRSFVTWQASLILTVDGKRQYKALKNADTHEPFTVTPGKGLKPYEWSGNQWVASPG